MCRSRRELSNAHLLAKFRFDTAENEPSKVCPIEPMRVLRLHLRVRALARGLERAAAPGDPRLAHRGEVLDGHRPLGAPEEAVATRAGLCWL